MTGNIDILLYAFDVGLTVTGLIQINWALDFVFNNEEKV